MRTLLGMQYGGSVPQQLQEGGVSSGLAYLRRGQKRKEARKKAREAEKTLAGKLGLSRTMGTVLGLGGGLLAAALAPATGGMSLLAPGLGTALGKYAGSRLGYGDDFKADDIMYGEEAGLTDIQDAADAYAGSMGQDAILSGAKASLMAGMAPDGGIYGKVAGRLNPSKMADGTVMVRGADGALTEQLIPSVDTEAIIGAKQPDNELMQAFKSADPMRENVMNKTRERALLAAQPGAISGGDDIALKQAQLGDIDFGENIERVTQPSLIGEEYALARDSSNLQKQMKELYRNLGLNIARAEGGLDDTITDQVIRESPLQFNPDINLQNVNMSEGVRPHRVFDPTIEPDLSEGNWLLEHGADPTASSVATDIAPPSVSVPESPVVSDSLIGLTDDFTMPMDTSVVAPSYADALANRGQYQGLINQFFQQYSPDQRSAENWMSMFQQPQIVGAMHGGVIKESPRTLLGFVG